MIEFLMQGYPILPEGLDLVEENEQITPQIQLDEELDVLFFSFVSSHCQSQLTNEERYKSIKAEILGDELGSGSDEDDSEEE
jgi:pre-mRNA-splicing factor CWC22